MKKLSLCFRIVANTAFFVVIIIGIFVAASSIPFKQSLKIFTVQSGSMEPAIKTGSLIFVKPTESYAVNDVITRRTMDPKVTVTHRIIEKVIQENNIPLFKTKGDANNAEDSEFVSPESIIGKIIFSIPYLGYPVAFAKTQQGLILLIIIPAVIIVHEEIQKIVQAVKMATQKKSNCKQDEMA